MSESYHRCGLIETHWCGAADCPGHAVAACHNRATVRLTSSTDDWPQHYACPEHVAAVAGADRWDNP